jgi:hypothetical protein
VIVSSPAEAIVWGLCELGGVLVFRTDPAQLIREGWPAHYYPVFDCRPHPGDPVRRLFLDFQDDWSDRDRENYAAWRKGRVPATLLVINRDGLRRILSSVSHIPIGELLLMMSCAQEGQPAGSLSLPLPPEELNGSPRQEDL